MYVITKDREKCLLRLDLSGFWDVQTLERFKADLIAAMADLPCGAGFHLVLANALEAQPQSQEVTAGLFAFVGAMEGKARRLAFVTGSAVVAMQARRLFDRPGFCLAETVEEAEAFLLKGDEGDGDSV